jgi:DNA polymerase-1
VNGKERYLYIDGFNLFYQCFQTVKSTNENGEPNGGYVGFLTSLQKLLTKFTPQRVFIVFDGPDAGRRRKSILNTYKDKRGRKNRAVCVEFAEGIKEYVDNEQQQLADLYYFLKHLPINILVIPYYEADDIIAYLVIQNADKANIISSTDKDYLQLVAQPDTYVWSPQKKILFDKIKLEEIYKVKAENFLFYRTIIGDFSDKLPGIKGIKETTLFEIFPQIKTEVFTDFWKMWEAIEKIEEKTKAHIKLKEGKEISHLNYKLMALSCDNLNLNAIQHVKRQLEEQSNKMFSKIGFKMFCLKEGISYNFKNDFDLWIRPFQFLKVK